MAQQQTSLSEAREMVRAEAGKVRSSLSAIAGSRWLMAILATLAIAFGTHLAYAPGRLPPVTNLSIAAIGLPTSLDWGAAGEQAQAAREAAERQDAQARAREVLDENAERIPLINAVGFGLSLVLLVGNMWVMTKRRRVSRG